MLSVARGTCYSIFVYDIALAINLTEAARRLTSSTRETIKHKRRAPKYFEYDPPPLRISRQAQAVSIADGLSTDPQIDHVIYDFGAATVIYRMPLTGTPGLLTLSQSLYENAELLADSRSRVEELLKLIQPAVSTAKISSFVEDYVIFQVGAFTEPTTTDDLITRYAQQVAQTLRAEPRELSAGEVKDALSNRISYGMDDIVIVDWNAAIVFDKEPEDALAVLEFVNVELLEMRFLDQRLDDALTLAYDRLSKRTRRFMFRSNASDLRDISQWQVDSAILFEGVNNALKLLGDQYLARLYRLAAERFHLADWDFSILRKLQTLEGIYQKISDQLVTRRMEVLEWIIILLFVISIILPFITQTVH